MYKFLVVLFVVFSLGCSTTGKFIERPSDSKIRAVVAENPKIKKISLNRIWINKSDWRWMTDKDKKDLVEVMNCFCDFPILEIVDPFSNMTYATLPNSIES